MKKQIVKKGNKAKKKSVKSGTNVKKSTKKEISSVHHEKRKIFLSMDLAERMIRVEQRISSKFGKKPKYNETEYYKSLTPSQKNNYQKHLKIKKNKSIFFKSLIILPLIVLGIFKTGVSGNVIGDYLSSSSINLIELLMIVLIFIMGLIGLTNVLNNKIKDNRFKGHFEILEDSYLNK